MATIDAPALPRLRGRVIDVLFLLAVGAILGSLPGWETCFFAWKALAMLVLAVLAFVSAWQLLRELDMGRRAHAVLRGWQLAMPLAAMPVLAMLGHISEFVELAGVSSELHARAWADPRDNVPHVAFVQTDEYWGYAYDDSGEIAKPAGRSPRPG